MISLATLVTASQAVAATRSRLQKAEHLAACLQQLHGDEIEVGVGYLSGEVPGGALGVGPAMVRDSRPHSAADDATLGLLEVHRELRALPGITGAGSKGERTRRLSALLARATADEQRFLSRLLIGELRHGALQGVMCDAIAATAELEAAAVRRAFMLSGDLVTAGRVALTEGAAGLEQFRVQVFRPVQPMLAQTAADVGEALERLDDTVLEYKLDGARVQAHKSGDVVRVFSRRMNDVTAAVPEVVEALRAVPVDSLILDGEVLAMRADGKPEPFQVTMRRFGRRKNVDEMRAKLPLSVYFFDALFHDGDELIDRPGAERHEIMNRSLPGEILIPRQNATDPDQGEAFYQEATGRGHEGIMAKAQGAPYEAGSRGASWLKIKPAHTLDLVVLGCEWGSGRRKGWLSNVHLGAFDPASKQFVMLGKTFKGLTDELLRWQTQAFLEREVSRDEWTVFVRPEIVVEIAFNELQESSQYAGGLALRFARVKRYRDDKTVAEADTMETVRAIHAGQRL